MNVEETIELIKNFNIELFLKWAKVNEKFKSGSVAKWEGSNFNNST